MKLSRLEALADGIFAIVMTILVLELHVPKTIDIGHGLIELWPKFLALPLAL